MNKESKPVEVKVDKLEDKGSEIVVSQREKEPLEKQTILLIGIVSVLALIAIIIGVLFSFDSTSSNHRVATTKVATKPVTAITPQKNDASVLASAVNAYKFSHNGSFPTVIKVSSSSSVIVCSGSCNSANSNTAVLKYYKPANIALKHYSKTIKLANASMVYVVIGAGCSTDNNSLGVPNGSSFAVLYGEEQNGSLKTQCLST